MTLVNLNSSSDRQKAGKNTLEKGTNFCCITVRSLPGSTKKIKEFMKKNFEFVFLLTKGVAFATFAS